MKITEAVRIQYEKQHRGYENKIRPLFAKALKDQYQIFIDWIDMFGSESIDYNALINESKITEAMILSYQYIGVLASKREYEFQKTLEIKAVPEFLTNIWRSFFTDYAINYAYRINNELSETTKQDVRNVLKYANENEITGNRLITLLKKSLGVKTRQRANLIARTEATTASNLAKEQGFKQWISEQEDEGVKIWIGRKDERERHDHFVLNDDILPYTDKWNVGGELALNPGDTNLSAKQRIQCRCTQVFMTRKAYDRLKAKGLI